MAETFSSEGIDLLLEMQPRGTSVKVDPTFLGLFKGATASTVPAFATVLAGNPAAVTEPAAANAYARVQVDGSAGTIEWGAIGAGTGNARRTTATQQSFPESTGSWGIINGFFLATVVGQGLGKAYYYANFSDLSAVDINSSGFTLRLTPYVEYAE